MYNCIIYCQQKSEESEADLFLRINGYVESLRKKSWNVKKVFIDEFEKSNEYLEMFQQDLKGINFICLEDLDDIKDPFNKQLLFEMLRVETIKIFEFNKL